MEMKEINKIVQLSDLQYEKLLKDRQIEIDGEIKVWEPDTLYVTPNNNYQWLFNKFYETAVKPNEVYHNPMNMKSLEQEYEYLTTEDNNLAYISAIGYTAILKNGDTIKVTESNKGTFYINGSVATNDYTYTGDGYEVVNVWAFEKDYLLALNDEPTFSISLLDVRNLMTTPVVGNKYKNHATTIKTYNFTVNETYGTKKIVVNGVVNFNQTKLNNYIVEVESDCEIYPTAVYTYGYSPLYSKSMLEKVIFPNLKTIASVASNSQGFLRDSQNIKEIYFPKLETIGDGGPSSYHFQNVKRDVVLPPTVKSVGNYVFFTNNNVILNCNKATFKTNWCGGALANFTMCDDWQASINIAKASANCTIDWFIDLFTNKLADMTGQDAPQINIPLAIFEALSPEQLAIARNKNWTVTGS